MWAVQNIEFRPVEMDFRSSGQGRHASTAVYANGMELINALDLVHFENDPVQLQVCGDCGVTGCASGGWISLRRLGEALLLVPCFREMANQSESHHPGGRYDHGPPYCVELNGPAYLRGPVLDDLGSRIPLFRELDRWPALTANEFTRIMQRAAPARLLGDFPNPPQIQRELVSVVDPGEKEEMISALDALLALAFASDEPVALGRGDPITFYLDQPGIVECVPLAFDHGTALLANGPDWIVSFASRG